MKKVFYPVTNTIKNTSEKPTKAITKTSIKNDKVLENINEKAPKLKNDEGMIAPYLASSLVNLFKPENINQFKLIKDPNSTKINISLIHGNILVTLCSNMLTFGDSNKTLKLDGDLLKTMLNYKFNVDHSNPQDRKIFREFAEKMHFDIENIGRPSTRDRFVIRLLSSTAIMASGISTQFLSSDSDELCDRLKLVLQEKETGNNSDTFGEEIVAIIDKLRQSKCISTKQPEQILIKCNLLKIKKK